MDIRRYAPAALFGRRAAIGRSQFLAVGFLLAVLSGGVAQLELMRTRSPLYPALASALGIVVFVLLVMAIRARLADGGLSMRWLALPFVHLALILIMAAFGIPAALGEGPEALLTMAGLAFLVRIAMVALLLMLLLVPTSRAGEAR